MDKAKYQMIIQWSDEDNCFLVALPDFPGSYWRTHGDTYDETFANGKEALESLILAYESTGEALPVPSSLNPSTKRNLYCLPGNAKCVSLVSRKFQGGHLPATRS